jgi:hypothetical protein
MEICPRNEPQDNMYPPPNFKAMQMWFVIPPLALQNHLAIPPIIVGLAFWLPHAQPDSTRHHLAPPRHPTNPCHWKHQISQNLQIFQIFKNFVYYTSHHENTRCNLSCQISPYHWKINAINCLFNDYGCKLDLNCSEIWGFFPFLPFPKNFM